MTTMTVNEVVDKLSFPVQLRPAMYVDANGVTKRGVGKQVVREDTNQSLSFVSDTYGLITHAQALTPVVQALDGMDFNLRTLRMDGAGRRVSVLATSKKGWDIGNNDLVYLSLLFANSYDRASALRAHFGAFRSVCTNGMMVEHEAFKGLNVHVRIIHSKYQARKLDTVAMGNSVAALYAAMDKQADTWRTWKNTEVKAEALDSLKLNVLEPVVGVRAVPSVVSRIFRGRGQDGRLTLWSIYNGITEHYTDKSNASKTPVLGTVAGMNKSGLAVASLKDWASVNQNLLAA